MINKFKKIMYYKLSDSLFIIYCKYFIHNNYFKTLIKTNINNKQMRLKLSSRGL